jgi:hypothetical protein
VEISLKTLTYGEFMALRQHQRQSNSAAEVFADRVPESEALVASLAFQHCSIVEDKIDGEVFCNILTYFGIGGIGKSELSLRLERWTTTGLEGPHDWGVNPFQGRVKTARWNLKDSRGSVDVLRLLVSVRDALGKSKSSWPAFDLAFAAYYSSIRPGEPFPEIGAENGTFESGLVTTLNDLAQDLGSLNFVAGLASSLLRRSIVQARKEIKRRAAYANEPELATLLGRCLTEPSAGHQAPELAASLLWLLSREIDRMNPAERPLITIFIDHFEYVQVTGRRDGEQTINQFVAALPYFLFVITGRNALDWHRAERGDLDHRGPRAFPNLLSGLDQDPRQHLVGTLSPTDSLDLLHRSRDGANLNISDEVLAQLAETTGGWPVHIDAVLTLAREMLNHKDRPLTLNDIGGSFETVISRLLDDLAPEEKRVLQACCLLPYFDLELAAAAGNVDVGSVERFTRRTLVTFDPTSSYPYRIHDKVRAGVRAAGAQVDGGWANADWSAAGTRGLGEAKKRYDTATAAEADVLAMDALALALNIAAEHSVWEEWLVEAVRKAPSISGLSGQIPSPETAGLHENVKAAACLVEALALPPGEKPLELLDGLLAGDTPFASSGGLWKAYRLRNWGRVDESLKTFEVLLQRFPEKSSLYHRQMNVTLCMSRRFVDAETTSHHLTPAQRTANEDANRRIHGETSAELFERYSARVLRAKEKESRRYMIELEGDGLVLRSRVESVPPAELEAFLGLCSSVGHQPGIRAVLRTRGYNCLHQQDKFHEVLEQLELYSSTVHPTQRAGRAELLALHALATGDTRSLHAAYEAAASLTSRPRTWIPVEILLEHLGRPVPAMPTQWLEPYPVVRDRWLTIMSNMVARSGSQ